MVVSQRSPLPVRPRAGSRPISRATGLTLLLAAALIAAGIAIVVELSGSAAAGWAWALWVLAFAALLARLIAALAGDPR